MSEKKVLIAYYSYSGNTKKVAEKIQELTGGDLFEIKTVQDYPRNYNDVVNQAKKEKQDEYKPELISNANVSAYDTIYLGTPVWWYTFATPIRTFLSDNNFNGKTIKPFCTHGGGGASSTYSDIQKLAVGATVKDGFASYEDSANITDVGNWVRE